MLAMGIFTHTLFDRQLGARRVEMDRHRAGAVAQIPDDPRAGGAGADVERGHVVATPRRVLGLDVEDGPAVSRELPIDLFEQALGEVRQFCRRGARRRDIVAHLSDCVLVLVHGTRLDQRTHTA